MEKDKIFYTTDNVNEIIVPDGIELICSDNYSLKKLTISSSVKRINSFYGVYALEEVYYNGSIENYFNIIMDEYTPLHYGAKLFAKNENNEYYEVKEVHFPKEVNNRSYGDLKNINKFYLDHDTSIICAYVLKNMNKKDIFYDGSKDDFINNKVLLDLYKKVKNAHFYVKDNDNNYVGLSIDIKEENNEKVINVDEKMEIVQRGVFEDKKLDELTLPNTIKEFKSSCFNKTSIKKLYYNGTIDEWCKIKFNTKFSNPTTKSKQFFVKENGNYVLVDKALINVDKINKFAFSDLYFKYLDVSNVKNFDIDTLYNCKKIDNLIISIWQVGMLMDNYATRKVKKFIINEEIEDIKKECNANKSLAFSLFPQYLNNLYALENGNAVRYKECKPLNYESLDKLCDVHSFSIIPEYNPNLPKAIVCGKEKIVFYEKSFYDLSENEREDIFKYKDLSFITDDVIIFRHIRNFYMFGTKNVESDPRSTISESTLIKYDSDLDAYLTIPNNIKKVKADCFIDCDCVLINYLGTVQECLNVFEKPIYKDHLEPIYIIQCKDGCIEFIFDTKHRKANKDLEYFFCYHGINELIDSTIIEHDLYSFLERRYRTYIESGSEIVTYSSNYAKSIVELYNDEDDCEYCILDLDNFLKITSIDYENG